MEEKIGVDRTAEIDASIAIESLNYGTFKKRFDRFENSSKFNSKDLNEQISKLDVRDQLTRYKKDIQTVAYDRFHDGVVQTRFDQTLLTVNYKDLFKPRIPTSRDLFHVYGPDRNNTKDWEKYYRYAWTQKGPSAIIYSTNEQIIQEGRLECDSYVYSGNSSFAIAGAGILFRPQFGDSKVSVRPFVQWLTSSSFTGGGSAGGTANASIGIYVESWSNSGGGYYVDRDYWMSVWSQNTQNYFVGQTANGDVTASDGLATEFLAVEQRKYAIYVYVFLETTAAPSFEKNEYRFVRLDMEAKVPYVVVEETLL